MPEFRRHGQITNSEVYLEDNSLVGICDEFQIPEISWNTIEHATLGQVAVFKAPARPLQPLDGSMKFSFVEPDLAKLTYNPTKVNVFQLHSKVDILTAEGFDSDNSYTLVTLCALMFNKSGFGVAKLGDLMDQELDFSCVRMVQRVYETDTPLFSVDVIANTAQVDGQDIWSR